MRKGFSLVELSIVLVILGLLVGGILAGKSLIRAAELRSVTSDLSRYQSAIYAFRDKYFALPGDMSNAISFWPSAVNGDGDGHISSFPFGANQAEKWAAWNQLAFAGMIEGAYNGIGARAATPGTNCPKGKISNTGYTLVYWDGYTDANDFTPAVGSKVHQHVLMFGTPDQGAFETYGAAITAGEAWNIDSKIDDGKIVSGKVQVLSRYLANCSTSADSTVTAYDISRTDIACGLYFLVGF